MSTALAIWVHCGSEIVRNTSYITMQNMLTHTVQLLFYRLGDVRFLMEVQRTKVRSLQNIKMVQVKVKGKRCYLR